MIPCREKSVAREILFPDDAELFSGRSMFLNGSLFQAFKSSGVDCQRGMAGCDLTEEPAETGAAKESDALTMASASKMDTLKMKELSRILTFQRNELQCDQACDTVRSGCQFDVGNALETLDILNPSNIFCDGAVAAID